MTKFGLGSDLDWLLFCRFFYLGGREGGEEKI